MQNRGGWQAFYIQEIFVCPYGAWPFSRVLKEKGFSCAGACWMPEWGRSRLLLWEGGGNCLFLAIDVSFLRLAEPRVWGSRLIHARVVEGGKGERRFSFQSVEVWLPCWAVACQCRGNRLNRMVGSERLGLSTTRNFITWRGSITPCGQGVVPFFATAAVARIRQFERYLVARCFIGCAKDAAHA